MTNDYSMMVLDFFPVFRIMKLAMPQKIVDHIVSWLKTQLKQSRASGYILGLSGGVDSATCAALIKKATADCLGLILPIESSVEDSDDAAMVASTFGLRTEYVDLTSVYQALLKLLPGSDRIAQGNIKARLRMVTIYYYANVHNYLVCGTGNNTEITLGYFTKFGDGACDVLPLGDLDKSQVREIARELGVPDKIIKKVPSAGLWQGQTDEGEIGFSYDEMDAALGEIKAGRATGDCAQVLQGMIARSEHKRQLPKICKL
jgi:NAD+ synthase